MSALSDAVGRVLDFLSDLATDPDTPWDFRKRALELKEELEESW